MTIKKPTVFLSIFPFFEVLSLNFRCNYAFCKTKSLKQSGARAFHWNHHAGWSDCRMDGNSWVVGWAKKGEKNKIYTLDRALDWGVAGEKEKYAGVFSANWFNFLWGPFLVNFIWTLTFFTRRYSFWWRFWFWFCFSCFCFCFYIFYFYYRICSQAELVPDSEFSARQSVQIFSLPVWMYPTQTQKHTVV